MSFVSRSYSGKIFRPMPEVSYDEDAGFFICATPWGTRGAAQKTIEIISDYIMTAQSDEDATSPFIPLTCLSIPANRLRTAVLMANEFLYREENKEEYVSGVELFAASWRDGDFSWVQVGHPQAFLAREARGLMPLGTHIDLSMDMSVGDDLLSPLPANLLGLDSSVNITVGSFVPQPKDQLVLLSRSHFCREFMTLQPGEVRLDRCSEILAQDHADMAFWLGTLDVVA